MCCDNLLRGKMWPFQVFHQDEHPDRESVHHWVGNRSHWQVVLGLFSGNFLMNNHVQSEASMGNPSTNVSLQECGVDISLHQSKCSRRPLGAWVTCQRTYNCHFGNSCWFWHSIWWQCFSSAVILSFVAVVVHGLHHKSCWPILIFPLNMLLTLLRKCQKQWREDLTCCPT